MRELGKTEEILAFLSFDPYLHLYEIGDLDDFFRPHTRFFAYPDTGPIESLFLLYDPGTLPVLLALEQTRPKAAERLLHELMPVLPRRFYAHLSPHLVPQFASVFRVERHGRHLKMALRERRNLSQRLGPQQEVRHLATADLGMLEKFYAEAYPGNWFDSRMLETGQFVGGFKTGELAAVAGIHVYSRKFRVAALGNIAVNPRFRSCGWGRTVTGFLCSEMKEIDRIGLNVEKENTPAVRCYESLGFVAHAEYEEFMVNRP